MKSIIRIVQFLSIFAIVLSGIITTMDGFGVDNPFSAIMDELSPTAVQLNRVNNNFVESLSTLFDLGGVEQSSNWAVSAGYAAIEAGGAMLTLGVRLVAFLLSIVINLYLSVQLMVYPFKFMFTIMGVGAFATQFLDLFANALMVGIAYTVIRFALFVWKGAAYDN